MIFLKTGRKNVLKYVMNVVRQRVLASESEGDLSLVTSIGLK